MQPNKTKLALQIGTVILGAACASNVSATSFNLTVNTISDVTLAEVQALSFGTNILTDASVACAMDATVPAPAAVFSDDTTSVAAGFGVITGAGCIGSGVTVATPGIYSITGEPTLDVQLTLNTEAQVGNFTFSPTGGCGVDHDNLAGTAGSDPCQPITVATPITLTLGGGLDSGVVVDGVTHFTVGGTITTLAGGLTSDTDYNATFLVNVIY